MVIGFLLALQVAIGVGEVPSQCRDLRPHILEMNLSGVPETRLLLREPRWLVWRSKSLQVVPRKNAPSSGVLLNTAREFLGIPYVWGGVGGGGYDCSGFVNKVYAENGYDLPRVSRDQFKVGVKTGRYDLLPGDLIFFVSKPGDSRISHVAIYAGDDEFIHAARGKGRVTFDRLSARYYKARFAGGRRILSLPPGRFSTRIGTALKGRLFEGPSSVPTNWDPVLSELGMHGSGDRNGSPLDEFGLSESGDIPREHEGEERPMQFSGSFLKGAVTHLGPRLLADQETSVGFRLGGGQLREEAVFVFSPEFSYFGHDNALQFNLSAPFRIPTGGESGGSALTEGWTTPMHYSKILRGLSFGQKESRLYLDLSRTLSGTLGHGQVMRYYTPNVASRYIPEYDIRPDRPDHLSLSFDTYLDWAGTEVFIDDVIEPHVFGTLIFARPSILTGNDDGFLKRLSAGVTYAVDRDAPYKWDSGGFYSHRSVHAIGLDLELKLYRSDSLRVKSYVDVSGLVSESSSGMGAAVGTLVRANITGRRTHVIRFRLEARLSQPQFIPSYFDMTYNLYRWRFPVADPGEMNVVTKLEFLELMKNNPSRWGIYSEFIYRMHRRITVLAAYEDSNWLGDVAPTVRFSGKNLTIMTQFRDFYLPGMRKPLDFYIAYHLRNFEKFSPILSTDQANEYLYASLSMKVWRYLSVDASIRKALALTQADGKESSSSVDGVLGMVLRYEL